MFCHLLVKLIKALYLYSIYAIVKAVLVLVPTRITNPTRIPDILPTTNNSVVLVVDCIRNDFSSNTFLKKNKRKLNENVVVDNKLFPATIFSK